ncbi:MAG: DUF5989 family protein [Elusimicrobiota bacterium]
MREVILMARRPSFIRDLLTFMWENKKWWMIPLALTLLILGALILLSASAPAPFIYTLF